MRYEIEKDYRNTIAVSLELTLHCNFNCFYCYQKDWDKRGQLEYKDCINFIKEIQKNYPNKTILVYILGGEALHYKDIDLLLNELYDMNVKTNIITNGSKSVTWWKEFSKKLTNVVLSYHYNEMSEDEFFKVCEAITENRQVSVNLMMEPDNFDKIYNFGLRLVNNLNYVIANLKVIKKDGYHIEYTEKQKEFLLENNKLRSKNISDKFNIFGHSYLEITEDNGQRHLEKVNQMMLEEKNRVQGWYCMAGIESFFVDHLGEVYGAFCKNDGSMGNIKNSVSLRKEPMICKKQFCDCRIDICITKQTEKIQV